MKYILSNSIGQERVPKFQEQSVDFGRAHYSWKINADLYVRALAKLRDYKQFDAPDIYQHDIAKRLVGIEPADVHLANKPIESLRPLFGNKNVAIQVWEFPEMSTVSHGGDPRLNQVAVLKKFDCVWCGSSFTASTMRGYDINAIHLPPPVAHFVSGDRERLANIPAVRLDAGFAGAPVYEDLESVLNSGNPVYLAVLAPYDRRKNLYNLLAGFLESRAKNGGVLIVKLILDNVTTTVANINELLNVEFGMTQASNNVVFVGSYLSQPQMTTLYKKCTFFVSAASAEGLNMPLIEAMAHGCAVIAPNNTAMKDYIFTDHAVVMESMAQPAEGPIHALHKVLPTTHFPPAKSHVTDAFNRATKLSRLETAKMGEAAAKFVKTLFGLSEFKARLEKFERGLK